MSIANTQQHLQNELIDTLWNVNTTNISVISEQLGINRYIMECK